MSLFQRLAGDTASFAFRLAFDRDPDQGRGATKEEAASWGSFQVWVEGRNLCAHWEDEEEVSSVNWYLLPLLEWLVSNWDCLFHEVKFPIRAQDNNAWLLLSRASASSDLEGEDEGRLFDWSQRHSLLSCRDGGLFPDIVFRRLGAMVEVSWGESELAGMPSHCRFYEGRGQAMVEPRRVAVSIHEVLTEAVGFLSKHCPGSQRILQLIDSLDRLRAGDRRSVRAALLAGLGRTFDAMARGWGIVVDRIKLASPEQAEAILAIPETDLVTEGTSDAALMFGSVSPSLADPDLLLLADKLVENYRPDGQPPAIKPFVHGSPYQSIREPWEEGYSLAESFIDELKGAGLIPRMIDFVDVEEVARSLSIHIEDIRLEDRGIRAVALAGKDHRPTMLLNINHRTNEFRSGKRFSVAHELCHILYDREYGSSLAIASGPWAPPAVEKRANAFAAMLLMPRSLLRERIARLERPLTTSEDVASLAGELGVSYTSLLHHLSNLGLLDEETMNALLEQATPPGS